MPNTNLQEAIERLADAADGVVSQLLSTGDPSDENEAPSVGVNGIVTSDPKIIESIIRIATVVGQPVVIDYTDEYGISTRGRKITPQSIEEPAYVLGASVVAEDEFRNGSIRRFRIDRIDSVST